MRSSSSSKLLFSLFLQNINLTANQPLNVACMGTGNVVTVATTGGLDMCDIYVQGYAR